MRFTKGNNYGTKSSRKGISNRIDKETLIDLVNLCTQDLKANFDNLQTYEKIKLIVAFQNIYRDQLTDVGDQAGTIPTVITLQPIYANELKENKDGTAINL